MILRNKQFNFRVSDTEIATIQDLSSDLSMDKATFIRYLLRQYVKRLSLAGIQRRAQSMRSGLYIQQGRIIKHIENVAEANGFNRFVTLSFVYSKSGMPFRVSDIAQINRLVHIYIKKVSHKLNGRPRKRQKKSPQPIPAIAIPEYRVASGGSSFLHFHCALRVPDESLDFFHSVTKEFWKRIVKNNIVYPPKIDSRKIYDARGLIRYIMKNIEDGVTIEGSVVSGIAQISVQYQQGYILISPKRVLQRREWITILKRI